MVEEKNANQPQLVPDIAITTPEQDQLGRAAFARNLAELVLKMESQDGIVVALYGHWGSGKTSTLNLVKYCLKQQHDDDGVIILEFNPWWFSGSENLLAAFLGQMQAALGDRAQAVRDAIREYSKPLIAVAKLIPTAGGIGQAADSLMQFLCDRDIAQRRADVDKSLQDSDARIVVMMDDIDRMTRDEVRQVFQLIKAVADFPNMVYIVAFEQKTVARALEEVSGGSGEEYLEKIVQVPINLPDVGRQAIRNAFNQTINQVLGEEAEIEDEDLERWGRVFRKGLDPLFITMRDVKRYANALLLPWPLVKGEVNVTDFLAIEALRVFAPEVYKAVKDNKELFVGAIRHYPGKALTADELAEQYNQLLRSGMQGPAKELLKELFPKCEYAFGGTQYGTGFEAGWRRENRICSEESFDTYFRLVVSEGTIANAEMDRIISRLSDPDAFAEEVRRLADQRATEQGVSRARILLWHLLDDVDARLTDQQGLLLLRRLCEVGDELVALNDSQAMMPWANEYLIEWISRKVLSRIPPDRRYEELAKIVEQAPALTTVVAMLRLLEPREEAQETEEAEVILSESELRQLHEVALQRIKEAAKATSLRDLPILSWALGAWADWGQESEVQAWVSEWISTDDEAFGSFVAKMLGYSLGAVRRGGKVSPSVHKMINWKRYLPQIQAARKRAEDIVAQAQAPDWLTDYYHEALDTFLADSQTPSDPP